MAGGEEDGAQRGVRGGGACSDGAPWGGRGGAGIPDQTLHYSVRKVRTACLLCTALHCMPLQRLAFKMRR